MRIALSVLLLLVLATPALGDPGDFVPEVRPLVGVYTPTGDQRDDVKDAFFAATQVGVEVHDSIHLLGTFGWSPSGVDLVGSSRSVNLYAWDIGVEVFRSWPLTESWMLRPFVGAGGGGRTYDLRNARAESKTYPAGYGALGMELQHERLALRIEARDYLTQYKGLTGDLSASNRNDLGFLFGAAFHLW